MSAIRSWQDLQCAGFSCSVFSLQQAWHFRTKSMECYIHGWCRLCLCLLEDWISAPQSKSSSMTQSTRAPTLWTVSSHSLGEQAVFLSVASFHSMMIDSREHELQITLSLCLCICHCSQSCSCLSKGICLPSDPSFCLSRPGSCALA